MSPTPLGSSCLPLGALWTVTRGVRSRHLSRGTVVSAQTLGISLHGGCLLPHLLVYCSISVDSQRHIRALGYSQILFHSVRFCSGHWEVVPLAVMPLWWLFQALRLLYRELLAYAVFPALALDLAISPGSPGPFYWRLTLGSKSWLCWLLPC